MKGRDLAVLMGALLLIFVLLAAAVYLTRETLLRSALYYFVGTPISYGQTVKRGMPFKDAEDSGLALYCVSNRDAQLEPPLAYVIYPTPTATGMVMSGASYGAYGYTGGHNP